MLQESFAVCRDMVGIAELRYIYKSNWFSEAGPKAAHPFAQGFADFSGDSISRWSAIVRFVFCQ